MADDDLDLDAMLDSALDEGFADPAAAQAGGEDDGDLDLDAMLDEAMVASVLDEGSSAAAAEKSRASSDFGPSQQWLQRKQGGQRNGPVAGGAGVEFSFLRPERMEAWTTALAEDGERQADMDKQRPFSRAYRSFYSAGKEEGGIVVHLGSGAAAAANGAKEALEGKEGAAGGGGDAEERGRGTPDEIFEAESKWLNFSNDGDVLSKGVSSSGVKEPPSIEKEDFETLDRLKASYLRLVVKDVRARVCKDPDVSTERFPGISSKILT